MFITEGPDDRGRVTHLVLPGVRAFPQGMDQRQTLGFDSDLRRLVSHSYLEQVRGRRVSKEVRRETALGWELLG